jgi:hypothetical protein
MTLCRSQLTQERKRINRKNFIQDRSEYKQKLKQLARYMPIELQNDCFVLKWFHDNRISKVIATGATS